MNPFGVLIVAVGVAASYAISIYQGLQLSPVPWIAGIYALIGAAAVTWEMVGWHRSAHLARSGRPLAFAMNIAGLALASVVTVLLFELAFVATALEGIASKNAVAVDNRASLQAERTRLQALIDRGGVARGVEAVDADIAGIKAHPRWATTHGCDPEWTTARDSRQLCERYAAALAERGQAESAAQAQKRITAISAEMTPLGAVGSSDARALYLSRMMGISEQGARVLVGVGVIAFLFFCRAIAPFTMFDFGAGAARAPRNEPLPFREAVTEGQILPVTAEIRAAPLRRERQARKQSSRGNVEALDEVAEIEAQIEAEVRAEMERSEAAMGEPVRAVRVDADCEQIEEMPEIDLSQIRGASGARGTPEALRTAAEQLRLFTRECVVPCGDGVEPASSVRRAYETWAADSERDVVDNVVFGQLMAIFVSMPPYAGRRQRTASKWIYRGIKLAPVITHRVEQRAQIGGIPAQLTANNDDLALMVKEG